MLPEVPSAPVDSIKRKADLNPTLPPSKRVPKLKFVSTFPYIKLKLETVKSFPTISYVEEKILRLEKKLEIETEVSRFRLYHNVTSLRKERPLLIIHTSISQSNEKKIIL